MRPLPRDLLVTVAAIAFAVVARLAVEAVVSGAVPFALIFPAVIGAALLAGWRAALFTVIALQLLTWYFVLPPTGQFFPLSAANIAGLALTTLAQIMCAWAVVAYRTSAMRLGEETAKRLQLMALAQQEIDHRTKNNFQLAASLLAAQAAQASSTSVAEQLNAAAARLQRIAATYKGLSLNTAGEAVVALDTHLAELCDSLRESILPPGVTLRFDGEPVKVPAEDAVAIGLITNEWITNSAKHAYQDSDGLIEVRLSANSEQVELSVADGGCGMTGAKKGGLGTSLVDMLKESLGGQTFVTGTSGTNCVLQVPR